MKRLLLAGMVALVLAVTGPAQGATPIRVATSLDPGWLYFADAVTASLDVRLDPRVVDPRSLRVDARFAPWEEFEPVRVSSSGDDTFVRRTWKFTISCLTFDCLPKGLAVQPFRLPPLTVTARRLDGSSVVVRRAWPQLSVAGRFRPPSGPNVSPTFRTQTLVPEAIYTFAPTSLAWALDGIGALVLALALGWALILFRRATRRRRAEEGTPLARALTLVRDAQDRGADDQRRAVGLLARTLPREKDRLSAEASQVAWSAPEPSSELLGELLRTVETDLGAPE